MAEEATKDKKEGNDDGKEGAANVKTCTLLLNNSANCGESWIRKKMKRKETSRNYTTQG